MIAIFKIRQSARVPVLLGIVATASLAWTLWLAYMAPESGFYFVLARVWEFVIGAIFSILLPAKLRHGKTLLWACVLALGLSASLLGENGGWPNAWTLLPVVFAATFIYIGTHAQNNPVIAHPGFQLLGDMSYSLYLWHWPVWVFALQQYDGQIPDLQKFALLLLVFALAYTSWRWVERPFRIKNRVSTRHLKMATATVFVCAIVFTAFAVTTEGAPSRFPDYIARVALQTAQKTPRNECFRGMHGTKDVSEEFCTFGANTSADAATAMMWGDSYANQYMTALGDASKKLGVTGLIATMSGCQAMLDSEPIQAFPSQACWRFNSEVNTFLLNHAEIKTVILGRNIWDIDATVSLVRKMVAQDRKVILVGPSPIPGVHVETVWATQQIRAGHPIDEIKIEKTPQVSQIKILEKLNAALKPEISAGKVRLIDPVKRYCDSQSCYLVRNGIATFRDYGHFTEIAAHEMEPDFHDALVWAK